MMASYPTRSVRVNAATGVKGAEAVGALWSARQDDVSSTPDSLRSSGTANASGMCWVRDAMLGTAASHSNAAGHAGAGDGGDDTTAARLCLCESSA